MTNDVPVVPAHMTIGEARLALREHLRAPDFVYYVYAVDGLEMQRHVLAISPLEPANVVHGVGMSP